jgi:hypothetical protein
VQTSCAIIGFIGPGIYLFSTNNGIQVTRGTTVLHTFSATPLSTTELVHVQVKIFSHATEGTAEVWVNGASLGSATGLNTGGADITSVQFASGGNSSTTRWDNLYISDEIEGELVSVLCKPSSDDATQFTPSAGTDNYAMVDDTAQDGDTTYVESGTVGHKDLYGYEDVPSGYLVKAATLVTIGRKDATAGRGPCSRSRCRG